MKKLTILILCVCMLLSTSITAYANTGTEIERLLESDNPKDHIKALKLWEDMNGPGSISEYSISEYDLAKNPEQKQTLLQRGYELSKLTENQLEDMNYSGEDINLIKNFDGSEAALRAVSKECYVYGGFVDFYSSANGTTTTLIAAFDWGEDYSPGGIFSDEDVFGVTFSLPFRGEEEDAEGHLSYYNSHYNETVTATGVVEEVDMYAFEMVFDNNELENNIGHWIDAGSIIADLSTRTEQLEIGGFAEYGLNTESASPSISISKGGPGVGLSFSEGVESAGSDRFYGEEE